MVTGNNRNVPETVKHSQVAKVEASLQSIRPLASSILAYFATKSFVSAKLPNAYLTEPTEKFVQEQQKTKSIEAAGDKARQDFQQLLDKLTMTESSEELVSILSSMTNYLGKLGDMPRGLKKSEIVKACRLKKYDPASTKRKKRLQEIWTPAVESEYVKLILRIDTLLKPESAVSSSFLLLFFR